MNQLLQLVSQDNLSKSQSTLLSIKVHHRLNILSIRNWVKIAQIFTIIYNQNFYLQLKLLEKEVHSNLLITHLNILRITDKNQLPNFIKLLLKA